MFRVKTNFGEVSIDSDSPDKSAPIVVTGGIPALANHLQDMLSKSVGFHGRLLGQECSPLDLHAVLVITGLKFQILEGEEILAMPQTPIPDGAVD